MSNTLTTIPNFKVVIYSIHREAVYLRALRAVEVIDEDLASGRRHYRNRRGELLTTLYEVMAAVEAGELAQ